MSAGGTVADLAALALVDMSSRLDGFLYVKAEVATYAYDNDATGATNGKFFIAANGGGGWHPISVIYGTITPTGPSDYPVTYAHVASSSTGNIIDDIYYNPGGGSSSWRRTATST